jgi:hypothetical protein
MIVVCGFQYKKVRDCVPVRVSQKTLYQGISDRTYQGKEKRSLELFIFKNLAKVLNQDGGSINFSAVGDIIRPHEDLYLGTSSTGPDSG